MSPLQAFPFPNLKGQAPKWTGNEFVLSGQKLDYLCYDEAESGWSQDLTDLHEKEAGDGNHPIDLLSRNRAIVSMTPVIKNQGVVLDVGCSSGFLLRQIKGAYPHSQLMGADYLPGIVLKCAKKSHGIPMLQFDLRNCPLTDNSLDGVVALNVLEHIDDDVKALGHIFRILKPGGIAHIEVPAGPALYDFYDEVLMHHRRYQLLAFREKVQNAGFRVSVATHLGFLLFPGFAWVKLRNRTKLGLSATEKAALVASQIRTTKSSKLIRALMSAESKLGSLMSLPCGIRCIVVANKPTNV